ncbi:MAG: hypothetical protein M0C28_14010 [Candidatus Moduliflexus flocculans]|nr:hypothetical protein [Candidatus Moduliflexus flocculans]
MKRGVLRLAGWAAWIGRCWPALLTAALTFEPGEYAARRARLMEKIADGAGRLPGRLGARLGLWPSGRATISSISPGVHVPNAFLVVDGLRKESVLFFTMSETEAESEGIPRELVRDPKGVTGVERVLPAEQFGPFLASLCQRTRIALHHVQTRGARPGERQREVQHPPTDDDPEPVGRAAHPGAPVRQAAPRQVPPGRDQGLLAHRLGAAQDQVAGRARGPAPGGPDRRQGPPRPDPVDPARRGRKSRSRPCSSSSAGSKARRAKPTARSSCPGRTTPTATTTPTTGS